MASRTGRKRPRPNRSIWAFRSAPRYLLASAVLFVVLIAYAIAQSGTTSPGSAAADRAQSDASSVLPGMYVPPHKGADGVLGTDDDRQHVRPGTVIPFCTSLTVLPSDGADSVCYSSNPPTSGPHSSAPMPFGVLEEVAPRESLVHNMEHGGVVVWVNITDARVLSEIEAVVRDALDRRRLVVMAPYPDLEPNTIALTSWTRLERLTAAEFTKQRLENFIAVHQRRFNPEGF